MNSFFPKALEASSEVTAEMVEKVVGHPVRQNGETTRKMLTFRKDEITEKAVATLNELAESVNSITYPPAPALPQEESQVENLSTQRIFSN